MSTAKVINIVHPSGTITNLVNDANGGIVIGGTLTANANVTVNGTSTFTGTLTAGNINITGNVTGNLTIAGTMTAANSNVTGTVVMSSSFKRNRIINGNMGVWQRGTSGFTTNNAYCADRWIEKADTSFTSAAQSSDVPAGYQYSLTVTGTGYAGIYQRIEAVNCYGLVGQSVTVSFWAKQTTGAGTNSLSVALYYPTSGVNNYTGGVTQIGSTINATGTTSWAQYSVTFSSLPSGALSGLAIYILSNVAGSSTALYTGVQLEVGTKATPYEMQIYSDQLAQCQRYYQNIGSNVVGATEGTTLFAFQATFWQPMRSAPTASTRTGYYFNVRYLGDISIITPTTTYLDIDNGGIWGYVTSSGLTDRIPIFGRHQNYSSGVSLSDFIAVTAEL